MEKIKLYNGVEMPIIGFGVFQIPDYNEAKRAVLTALEAGYRLIDTAQAYMNEQAVGDAIKESRYRRLPSLYRLSPRSFPPRNCLGWSV